MQEHKWGFLRTLGLSESNLCDCLDNPGPSFCWRVNEYQCWGLGSFEWLKNLPLVMCLTECCLRYNEFLDFPNSCFLTLEPAHYLTLEDVKLRLIAEQYRLKRIRGIRESEFA